MGTLIYPIRNSSSSEELIDGQVFILEGLPALLMGIYTFFFLPDCKCSYRI